MLQCSSLTSGPARSDVTSPRRLELFGFPILPSLHSLCERDSKNLLSLFKRICLTFYSMAQAQRRLFMLRDQLKVQFKATQKAQVNERKASESKRRLTS